MNEKAALEQKLDSPVRIEVEIELEFAVNRRQPRGPRRKETRGEEKKQELKKKESTHKKEKGRIFLFRFFFSASTAETIRPLSRPPGLHSRRSSQRRSTLVALSGGQRQASRGARARENKKKKERREVF
jgi:hypothetical protein